MDSLAQHRGTVLPMLGSPSSYPNLGREVLITVAILERFPVNSLEVVLIMFILHILVACS